MNQLPPIGYRWSNIMPLLLPEPRQIVITEQAPEWPRQFETFWRPIPGGPDYTLVGTTQAVSTTVGHFTVEDTREITVQVLRSKQRRVNDWKDWRLCLQGKALHPEALTLRNSSDSLVVFAWGKSPLIVMNVALVGIRHISTPTMWGQSDFTLAEPNFITISTDHPITESEMKLAERGKKLFARFVSTMTARGRPGSGRSYEQRQSIARRRLLEAGQKLRQKYYKIGRRELMAPLLVNSIDAVAEVMRAAGWKLEDLERALNSTHAA
jgi:hypothetical protein